MTSTEEFWDFINKLFSMNVINENSSDLFMFLAYDNYTNEIKTNKFVIYEDWWVRKPDIVKSKIISILGVSERIFARKCEIKKITKPIADAFLEENHIYGTTKLKIKLGLFYHSNLVSIITFAGQRQFHDGSRSVELLRYCNKNGYTVVGGLDKLLKAYIKEYQPDAIMTYIDLDWGNGQAFKKLGFEKDDVKLPITFFVNKKTGIRIQENSLMFFEKTNDYTKVLNSGSLKLILPINT